MSNTSATIDSSTGTPERRVYARRQTSSLAYVDLGEDNGGLVLNVSEGGIAVHAAVMLAGDQLPKIRFQLPQSIEWIESAGQVTWTGDSRKNAGIEFVGLPEEARAQIRNWLTSIEPVYEPPSVRRRTIDSRRLAALASVPDKATAVPAADAAPPLRAMKTAAMQQESEPAIGEPAVAAGPAVQNIADESESPSVPAASVRTPRWPINPGLTLNAQPPVVAAAPQVQPRNWLVLAGAAGLLVAASFTVGLATGRGAWTGIFSSTTNSPANNTAPAGAPATQPAAGVPGSVDGSVSNPAAAKNTAGGVAQTSASGNGVRSPSGQLSAGIGVQAPNGEPTAQSLTVRRAAPSQNTGGAKAIADENSGSVLSMPDTPVSASDSVAVSSRLYIPVPAAAEPAGSAQHNGNVQIGRLESRADIVYPEDAKQQRVEGIVKLHITIGADGAVKDAAPMSGTPSLAAATLDAVRQWRYKPTTMDGRPIETEADITAVFRLPQTPQ